MSQRLLVIALDAADPELIERWVASGDLPTLGRLFAEGTSGRIRGLDGFFVGSTWPSLYTGLSPAGHGHHSLVQLRTGTYSLYRCADERLLDGAPFWQWLSDAGRRVAILDVPLSEASDRLHGIQTVEWGSHDALYGFRAVPRSLEHSILQRFGAHPLGPSCDGSRHTTADYRAFVDRLLGGVRAKRDLTRALLADTPWDFAIQVFTESHCVGHQCWHLHDPTHPAHDAEIVAALGDPLLNVYRECDAALGAILADHPDTPVIVLSAHGMSYWYGAQFLLTDILVRLGYAKRWPTPREPGALRAGIESVARRIWHLLPDDTRARIRRSAERLRHDPLPSLPVDAAGSACFPVNNGLAVGGIRLNLQGREPGGTIAPGAEADALCETLAQELLAITDARTGRPAIRRVVRTAERYRGPHLADLPDLLIEWSDDTPTGSALVGHGAAATVRLSSASLGELEAVNRFGRTGEHRPEGFFVARLPNAAPERLEQPVSILDFAPTFCTLMGVEPPPLQGSPIAALV